jgi:hypothetical protein
MAISADITTLEPTMVRAIGIGTEMASRINGAFAAPIEEDERRW